MEDTPTAEAIEQLLDYARQHCSTGRTTRRPGVPEAWYEGFAWGMDTVLQILDTKED